MGMGEIMQRETEDISGLDLTFERETKYTGILIRHDPGTIWVWIGSALLVIGMCITSMFQYRRIWVRVLPMVVNDTAVDGESSIRFGASSRWDASYQRLFETWRPGSARFSAINPIPRAALVRTA